MALRDPNTLDLAQQKLRLAEDIRFWPVLERGQLVYRIEITAQHRFFRIGYEEYVFASLLDGETTIPQACGMTAAKLGRSAPTADQAGAIARWLLSNKLAYLPCDGAPSRGPQAAADSPASRLFRGLNPFWIKIPVPYGERIIPSCASLLRPLFGGRAIALGVCVIVIGLIVLASHWSQFVAGSDQIFHPTNWIWLLVSWISLKIIHELAHAAVCDCQGGQVRESGIVLILLAPLAYVDVTSCWRMPSRWSRIAVASAGMYVELLIAAVAVLLWTVAESESTQLVLHNLVVTAGLSTLLFNANVLMRFDGYFILADLVEIPNLYSEGSGAVTSLVKRITIGQQSSPSTLIGWRRRFVVAYGIAALAWRLVVCVSLCIAASTMLAGAGVVIAAIGIASWFARPLTNLCRFATELRFRDPNRLWRGAIVSIGCVVCGAWALVRCPFPSSVTVPAVVRYLPETMVRSRADGFVSKIHVTDGARVDQGQLLIELENRELSNRLAQLDTQRQQIEIRLRQAIDKHDPGSHQILRHNLRSLAEQFGQLQQQAAGLRVVACRSGRIVAPGLDESLGTYIKEGDPLFVVAEDADKELVAVIEQDVIKQARQCVGREVRIRTIGFRSFEGQLDRIEPRATDRLPELSLAATEGGMLAVTLDRENEPRLLEPHFRGRVRLPPTVAAAVPAGIKTWASLGYQLQPIAERVRIKILRLWHAANHAAY